jgi:hypothetical protein
VNPIHEKLHVRSRTEAIVKDLRGNPGQAPAAHPASGDIASVAGVSGR